MNAHDTSIKSKREQTGELTTIYSVDSFNNGIAFGQHRLPAGEDARDFYSLHITDDLEKAPLRSRYALHNTNPLQQLESHLMRLSQQGVLGQATIFFGSYADPFFPFEGKFDASMRFLELFQRYTPGHLTVQTRSPLLVIALPVLKRLGKHVSVTLGIETHEEESVLRYTPGLPRVEERLKTATALRRFGVEVNLQVSPVLPYGDWRKDAKAFAEILASNGDHVHVRPFLDGTEKRERSLRNHGTVLRLAEDRKFHWLRPDAATPLISEIEKIAPEKLRAPKRTHLIERQLDIFGCIIVRCHNAQSC